MHFALFYQRKENDNLKMCKKWLGKLRRPLTALLAAGVVCGSMPAKTQAAWFSDVPYNAWYAEAVEDLSYRGIMNGTGPATFSPFGTISRAEFVAMLARSALDEWELGEYDYRGDFNDVSSGHWANKYINWASEAGVASGTGGGSFSPGRKVTRQDMAVMVVNFAKATGLELPITDGPLMFLDQGSISGYASDSVSQCQRAGIINGYDDLTFRPKGNATRCEAASIYSRFLNRSVQAPYKIIRKRMNGVSLAAVEFDPNLYNTGVAMGEDRVRGGETSRSLFNRLGAEIAVNGAFFDFDTYIPYGTIIDNGRLVTVYNNFSPAKSAITMDSTGHFTVENFRTEVSASLYKQNGTEASAGSLGVNRLPSSAQDGTRIMFTRDWGSSLGFSAKYAAAVDSSGIVTAVYRDQDAPIPQDGYLLAQRGERKWDNFLPEVQVGDQIIWQREYVGASTQDIQLSLGSGPKIVQDGQPYGDYYTYAAEGFELLNTMGDDRRVCIGITYEGKLVILTAYTSLPELSHIMVGMDCESAVNLDGGGSTNLYVDGNWLYGPTDRGLNSVLYFW